MTQTIDYKIKAEKTGNCACVFCGKVQEGYKLHPYTFWWKCVDEKRGHNEPVCSIECAKKLADAKLQKAS